MNRFFEALALLGLFYFLMISVGIIVLLFFLYEYYALFPAAILIVLVYRLLKRPAVVDLYRTH